MGSKKDERIPLVVSNNSTCAHLVCPHAEPGENRVLNMKKQLQPGYNGDTFDVPYNCPAHVANNRLQDAGFGDEFVVVEKEVKVRKLDYHGRVVPPGEED